MSAHTSHAAQAAAPAGKKGFVALLTWPLRAGLESLKKRPVFMGAVLFVVVTAIIGIAAAGTLAFSGKPPQSPAERLAFALDRLDSGDYNEARRIAAELRADTALSAAELGGAMYILGAITAYEAEDFADPRRRQLLFRIGARYLEESRDRGMPETREAEGLFLIGKSLFHGGRYPLAVIALKEALELEDQPHRTEIHRLLAEAYLDDRPPQPKPAIAAIEAYLADPKLPAHDRRRGTLWQAKIQLQAEDLEGCRRTLASMPENTPLRSETLFLESRLLLAEGDQLNSSPDKPPADSPAAKKFAEAIEKLRGIHDRDGNEARLMIQVQFLLGLAYERLGETEEAEQQFTRVRRQHYGTPESLAAAFHLASLQLLTGHDHAAVQLFKKSIVEASVESPYENPWEPLPALERRLQDAFDRLIKANEFAQGVELAEAWPPLIVEHQSLLARATAHRAWAQHLEKTTGALAASKRPAQLAEARHQYRLAGEKFAALSELRRSTKFFEDDLWSSADCYLNGQAYRQAALRYRDFLKENARHRRPEALRGMGESLLAEGKLSEALETFRLCLSDYPKHPASYRARLRAAAALQEQGDPAAARDLLIDNLYNFSLTPQSNEWRDSLFALGENQYQTALELEVKSRQEGVDDKNPERRRAGLAELEKAQHFFQDAVKTLTEAVQRFPDAPQVIEARYHIAESYRQAAKWPRKRLGTVTIETTRTALNVQLQTQLTGAVDEYARLLQLLDDDEQSRHRLPTESAILRNCYFGRADALFDLGRYEDAVAAYSAATNRYQHEPEALEAYIQVAACHRRMNKGTEARGTIEQAKVVLRRIRPDADFTRTTRYTRDQWSQVLDWLATL